MTIRAIAAKMSRLKCRDHVVTKKISRQMTDQHDNVTGNFTFADVL